MQAVIRGKLYDTSTATKVCDYWHPDAIGGTLKATMYKSPNGRFFAVPYSHSPLMTGGVFGKFGVLALDVAQARHHAENVLPVDAIQALFPVEVA